MSDFVDFKKRGILLPKGCKDLADMVKLKQQETASPRESRCEYCGGPAVLTSSVWCDGQLSEHSKCGECLQDLFEFESEPENSLPDDADFNDEAVKRLLEDISCREAEFMRNRVAARKAPR